jgi:hypothetical protein
MNSCLKARLCLTDKLWNFPPESTIAKRKSLYLWKPVSYLDIASLKRSFALLVGPIWLRKHKTVCPVNTRKNTIPVFAKASEFSERWITWSELWRYCSALLDGKNVRVFSPSPRESKGFAAFAKTSEHRPMCVCLVNSHARAQAQSRPRGAYVYYWGFTFVFLFGWQLDHSSYNFNVISVDMCNTNWHCN